MLRQNSSEEETHGGSMCLPCCSNRVYTNRGAHYMFTGLTITSMAAALGAAAVYVSSSKEEDIKIAEEMLKLAGYFALGSLTSAVGASITFFCGTKPKADIPTEDDALVATPNSII